MRRTIRFTGFLVMAALTGCPQPPADTTPPTVLKTTPAADATNVPLDAVIAVDFSEPMAPASITAASFKVEGPSGPVSGALSYDDAANRASFLAGAPLAENALHTVTLTTGLADANGNNLASASTFKFTTVGVPPKVVRTVPDKDAVGVPLNVKVSIEFSEPMNTSTINATTITLAAGATSVAGAVTYDAATRKAELAPGALLSENTEYTLTVAAGARDANGVILGVAYSSKFITQGDAPTVASTTPADGATGVPRNVVVKFQFNKAIDAQTLSGNLRLEDSTPTPVAFASSYDAATFTVSLTPGSPLDEGETYRATALKGIRGTNRLNLPADKAVSFTVIADAPTVVSTVPADQAQNVPTNTPISGTFSEPIDPATLGASSFFLKEGTNTVATTTSLNAPRTTASLAPAAPLLEGRNFTATLTTAITDAFGNPMAAAKTWTFRTEATVPSVTGVSPANNATGVAGNTPVRITFSEAMDPASFTASSFQVMAGAVAVAGTRSWDAPSRTAIFQPSGSYPGGATITVRVTTACTDPSGIALAADVTSSFQVSNAPAVTASTPSPNDVNVPLASNVALTFSTAMDQTTLNANNVWVETPAAAKVAAAYSSTATALTMNPNADLNESTRYTVVVTTAVRSATNVPFAAEYRFSFTTLGVPPQVSGTLPTNNAGDVRVSVKIQASFNEDMDPATFTAANFTVNDGANAIAGSVAAVGLRTIELTPSAKLAAEREYTATLGTGIKDAAGNGLSAPYSWTFSTEELPAIRSVQPANGATGVALNAKIVLQFNKDIASVIKVTLAAGGPTEALTLSDDTGAKVDGAVVYTSATRTAVVRPQAAGADIAWSASRRYTLSIDGTKLADANGNAIGGSRVTSFVTGTANDATGPTVTSTAPANGATGVSRTNPLWAEFSEPVSAASVNGTTVRVLDGATALPGTVRYDPGSRRAYFDPTTPLPANRSLVFAIGAVADLSGNAKAAANTIALTTADNPAPALAAAAPANNAANVAVNTKIRLAFSEPVNPTTLSLSVTANGAPVSGATAYDGASMSAVFSPATNFAGGATVVATVAPGLADEEGKATSAAISVSFQTVANAAQDVTKPGIQASSPANAATGVLATASVQITFSEPMAPATVVPSAIAFRERGGPNVHHDAEFDAAADRLTLYPTERLKGGVVYDVVLAATVADLAGNGLNTAGGANAIAFTAESTRPSVSSTSPAASSTVGNAIRVDVVFSEPLDEEAITPSTFHVDFAAQRLLGAVSYDAATRTATFQSSKKLSDGSHLVVLEATSIADLAGNTLVPNSGSTYQFSFTVSSTGPSVTQATPCGTQVDAYDFGTQVVTVTFDRGVKKSGGGALDGTCLKLKLGGTDQAATISHATGGSTATLTPSAALQAGSTYTLEATTLVVDNNTNAALASPYTCTFSTQKVIFKDLVDDLSTTGYTVGAQQGGNVFQRINSQDDNPYNSIVWRAGNQTDTQNYARDCRLINAVDYTITLEKQLDLTGLSNAEVRLDVSDDINAAAGDVGKLSVVDGAAVTDLSSWSGQNLPTYATRVGKGSNNLQPYVNKTIKLRWSVFIKGVNSATCGAAPPGRKGLFVDNLYVVGD